MDRRKELGDFVRARRLELRLSVRAAAKQAGVDRQTWQSLEDGTRATQDRVLPAVEEVLGMQSGALARQFGGDEAVAPAETGEAAKPAGQPPALTRVEALLLAALDLYDGDPAEFEAAARRVAAARQDELAAAQRDDPEAVG